MKYFLDTEFHEYKKQPTVCGLKVGKPIDTIELISIGIVSEDIKPFKYTLKHPNERSGHIVRGNYLQYYAICKDFDLKAAWGNEWLRENVLKPIFNELQEKQLQEIGQNLVDFCYKDLKYLINKYGKTREQIAEEIKEFTLQGCFPNVTLAQEKSNLNMFDADRPEFYAYYADYDWVVFCWLFGRMIDLPKGFPMYCIDIKQEMDKIIKKSWKDVEMSTWGHTGIEDITRLPNYPKQTDEHNALADAKWNKELYNFLNSL